jgi:hypothetical protein
LANSARGGNFDGFQHRQEDTIGINNQFHDFWKDHDQFFNSQPFVGSSLRRQWSDPEWGTGANWGNHFNRVGFRNDHENRINGVNWPNNHHWRNGVNWNNDPNWLHNDPNWINNDPHFRNNDPKWNGQSVSQSTMTTNNNGV